MNTLINTLGTPTVVLEEELYSLKDPAGVARAVHALTYVNNSETDAEHPGGETIMAISDSRTEFSIS